MKNIAVLLFLVNFYTHSDLFQQTVSDVAYGATYLRSDGTRNGVCSIKDIYPPECLYLTVVEYMRADCYGNLGYITVAGTEGTPPYSFLWNDGFTGDARVNVPAGASYQVTITDAIGCSQSGGYDFQPEHPAVGEYGDINIGCNSDTVLLTPIIPAFTENKSAKNANYAYSWTASNGGVVIGSPDTVAIYVVGPGTFTLVVTDTVNGCSSVRVVDVGVDTLKPTADAGPDLTVPCSQSDFALQASYSLNGATADSAFSWTYYDGVNEPQVLWNSDSTTMDVHYSGTYVFTVVNANNGCSDSDTVVVTPTNLSPPITVTGGELNCVVTEVMLQVMLGGDNTLFYGWIDPDGFTIPELNPVINGPGGYTAISTDTVNGCTSSAWLYVPQNLDMPNVDVIAYGDGLNCAEAIIFLEVYTFVITAPYTYEWSGPDNFSSSQALVEVNLPGLYTVVTTHVLSGCTSLDSILVTEPAAISVAVDSISDDIGGQGIGAIFLSATGGTPPLDFLWINLTTEQTYSGEDISSLVSAYYQCEITDANGCSYTSDSIFVNNLVGTTEADWSKGITLYPNPATGFVNFVYPSDAETLPEIHVYNIFGQRVDVGTSAKYPGHLLLNTGNLVPGVYQVWIKWDGKNGVKQMVVVGE